MVRWSSVVNNRSSFSIVKRVAASTSGQYRLMPGAIAPDTVL